MKILIISRIIFPKQSPRAFRTTELATELARRGHDVTVYAVQSNFDYTEFTKKSGIKVKTIKMTWSTLNSVDYVRYNLLDKILKHALGYPLEFPDIEFCWKVPQILKKEKNVDLLITIAYPHPIHWGAAIAKKCLKSQFPQKWISDCGDPYMGSAIGRHPFYFKYIENFWGRETDYVTIPIEEARKGYSTKIQDKIRIVPQGFDFSKTPICTSYKKNNIPAFAYAGTTYKGVRDPSIFLEYLTTLKQDFRLHIYGGDAIFNKFRDRLGNKMIIHGKLDRKKLIYELSTMDFLINLTNPNSIQSPSKLIDYSLSKRPVLDISLKFEEVSAFNEFIKGDYSKQHQPIDLEIYDIRNVVDKFLSL